MVEMSKHREEDMYNKIKISGKIKVVTGMHIGGSSAFSAIGAVDSPVIRDKQSDLPMIPGTTLKGKLRTLMAKGFSDSVSAMIRKHDDDQKLYSDYLEMRRKLYKNIEIAD